MMNSLFLLILCGTAENILFGGIKEMGRIILIRSVLLLIAVAVIILYCGLVEGSVK